MLHVNGTISSDVITQVYKIEVNDDNISIVKRLFDELTDSEKELVCSEELM